MLPAVMARDKTEPPEPTGDDQAFWDALDRVEECLAEDDLTSAQVALREAQKLGGSEDPDVLYAEACIVWQASGVEAAVPWLERVIAGDPEHADAHYALGCAAEERGEHPRMVEHNLRVLALDARDDRRARLGQRAELDHIEAVARELLNGLPDPFAERLTHVPVVLERRPSRDLVKDGFDPRALGLFEGPTHGDTHTPAPTRIVLYVNNLLADFPNGDELDEQVEVTLLHEIGHFFGLDEEDMVRLGLD